MLLLLVAGAVRAGAAVCPEERGSFRSTAGVASLRVLLLAGAELVRAGLLTLAGALSLRTLSCWVRVAPSLLALAPEEVFLGAFTERVPAVLASRLTCPALVRPELSFLTVPAGTLPELELRCA